jgi:hypothetical protein
LETLDELTRFLTEKTADGFRARLQARGEARALIRQDGVLPDDAPAFGETIDTDLTEYGFSLLRASLALREAEGIEGSDIDCHRPPHRLWLPAALPHSARKFCPQALYEIGPQTNQILQRRYPEVGMRNQPRA